MVTASNNVLWLIEQAHDNSWNSAIMSFHSSLSYKEMFDECLHVSNHFTNLGIMPGDNVGILFSHHPDFWVVVNSLWIIGAVPVPLNTRNTEQEILQQLVHAKIKYLIIDTTPGLTTNFSKMKFSDPDFCKTVYFDKTIISTNEKANLKLDDSTPFALRSALILFTSGSSGKPKAVVHTFHSLFESVTALDSFCNLSMNNIWLASLPLYHIGGFMVLVRSLIAGSCIAFPDSLKHEEIKSSLEKFNPSYVSLVPTMLKQFLSEDVQPNNKLKYVFLGGGRSDEQLCFNVISTNWPIVKVYGSTETCSMVTALLPEEIKIKPSSSGKPLGRNTIKIMNASDDIENGEILIHSDSLFKEYYNDTETTNKHIVEGWYHSGDYGWCDAEGYLFIEARRDDLIITDGENVNPNEVEAAIKNIDNVKDAFVFGIEDEKWGQLICAAIIAENITEDNVRIQLKEKIAGYKIPKKIFFVKEIPRNEMSKIKRSELFSILKLD
jgi:O-succinylbenzoic acid--CoA ligase